MSGGINRRKDKHSSNSSGLGDNNKKKKDIINPANAKKDLQTKAITNKNKIDPELDKLIKGYPVNFSNSIQNKIYLSLNRYNIKEGSERDCQIEEIYKEIKYDIIDRIYSNIKDKLNSDTRFFAGIICGVINKYIMDYSHMAIMSNHLGYVEEICEILKSFSDELEFYKSGVIPLALKQISPSLLSLQKQHQGEEVIIEEILE